MPDPDVILAPMTGIDVARDQLRTVLADLTDPLPAQDAAQLTGDSAYFVPVIAAVTSRIHEQLNAADGLPGLYTTVPGGDPHEEPPQAGHQLNAARGAGDELAHGLDVAHNLLT